MHSAIQPQRERQTRFALAHLQLLHFFVEHVQVIVKCLMLRSGSSSYHFGTKQSSAEFLTHPQRVGSGHSTLLSALFQTYPDWKVERLTCIVRALLEGGKHCRSPLADLMKVLNRKEPRDGDYSTLLV